MRPAPPYTYVVVRRAWRSRRTDGLIALSALQHEDTMSRQFDAKQEALKAYPTDRESGVRLLLDYLEASEKDFFYEEGMTPEEYIYGAPAQHADK